MKQADSGIVKEFNFAEDAPVTLFGNAVKRILQSGEPDLLPHLNAHRYLTVRSTGSEIEAGGLRSRWPTGWAGFRRPFPGASFDVIYVADLSGNEPQPVIDKGLEILRALIGLKTSVGVVNLSRAFAKNHQFLADSVAEGQVTHLDPAAGLGDYRMAAIQIESRRRAFEAQLSIEGYLDDGVHLADRSLEPGAAVSLRTLLWQRLRDSVESSLIVVRDPLTPYGSVSIWNERMGGAEVVSFQHGVVSGIHNHVPVLGSGHLTYGPASASLLNGLNEEYAASLKDYHAVLIGLGNFIHRVDKTESNESRRSLLILDQSSEWADTYYGIRTHVDQLFRVASSVLLENPEACVTLRPHPYCTDVTRWVLLMNEFGSRVSISHALVPLDHDIQHAKAAVSLFSGAALGTAANGVPTFLLGRDGQPWTADLASFAPVTVHSDNAAEMLTAVLRNDADHESWAAKSLQAAERYFGDTQYRPIGPEVFHDLFDERHESLRGKSSISQ